MTPSYFSGALIGWPSRPGVWRAAIVLYVAVLLIARAVLFPGASEDDGEALFYAQGWAWGYKGNQPPLHTWLVLLMEHVTGPGVIAVLTLKFSLIAAFHLFAHQAARLILDDDRLAAITSLSLIGCWVIGWDIVVNYSHTVLAAAAMAASVWAMARLTAARHPLDYALLGVCFAAGVLGKYNFAFFLIPLLAGAFRHRPLRDAILDPLIAITVGVAAAIAAAPLVWLAARPGGLVSAGTAYRLFPAPDSYLSGVGEGLFSLVTGTLGFMSPVLVLALIFLTPAFRPLRAPRDPQVQWGRFWEAYLASLGLLLTGVVLGGVTDFRNNWMLVWFPAVFYLMLRLGAAEVGRGRARVFVGVLAATALAVPVGLSVRAVIGPDSCQKCNFFIPYQVLGAKLKDAGFQGGTVLAHDFPNQIAGNLRRVFPETRMLSTRWTDYSPPERAKGGAGQCLLVWRAGKSGEPDVLNRARRLGISVPPGLEAETVTAPLPGSDGRTITWRYHLLPGRSNCR